jgi:hypothetical protein
MSLAGSRIVPASMAQTTLSLACLAAFALSAAGCTDACDEAAEKAEECGILPTTIEDDEVDLDCDGALECSAECVNQATCADLQNRDDPDTAFHQCLVACEQGASD